MESKVNPSMKKTLLIVNSILLSLGNCGGPLIMRLYFIHGGKRVWLSAFLETSGFPFIILVLIAAFFLRKATAAKTGTKTQFIYMGPRVFIGAAAVGILTGADDYLYAYGVARLPISTSALIIASQLAFTAGFAFLLVKQKFTAFSINAVVLLTVGAGVLALHTSSDRPKGETKKEYVIGFVMTIGAAALYGFVLPLVEMVYNKAKQSMTYTLVLEFQTVMSLFATMFCLVGMLINNDHKVIPIEARDFGLGESKYYVILVFSMILWQCFFLGAVGVIFCASSLLSGIIIAVLLPVTEVLAVIFYQEKFQAEKGVALVLSLWGFVSYFYGEFKENKENKENKEKLLKDNAELELPPAVSTVIPIEARDFGLGESKYYVILVFSMILWQCFFLGAVGVIFCASSLLSGIIIAVLLPVTEVLAVIFYQEKFQAEKGVALVLSLWGFVSYFYGEFKENKENKEKLLKDKAELELPPAVSSV